MAVLLFSLPLWMHGAAMAFSSSLNVSDDVAETPVNWTSKLCRSSVFCSDPSIGRQPSTSWGLHPQTFGTVCNCVLSHCYPTHWNTVLDGSSSHLAGCLSSGLIPSTLLAADKQYEGTPRWPGETRRVTALVYCQTDWLPVLYIHCSWQPACLLVSSWRTSFNSYSPKNLSGSGARQQESSIVIRVCINSPQ